MIALDIDTIDESVLLQLCSDQCPESSTLDFKRDLPGNSDKDKAEISKDVCAFANAGGGDLVYGIQEADGGASAICPITAEAEDAACRRLGQILDANLEPRITGLRLRAVKVTGGYVLIVRVPASFNSPHRYYFNNGYSKFVMRNGTHTTELSYEQLRSSFDRKATLVDRARRLRGDRIALIGERQSAMPMKPGPVCVVHLIPVASLAGHVSLDLGPLYNDIARMMFSDWGGGSRHFNLDGVVAYPFLDDNGVLAYTQMFRSGAFEAARHGGLTIKDDISKIPSTTIAGFYRDATIRAFSLVQSLGITGPAVLGWALLDVKDAELALAGYFRSSYKSDRKDLVLPETWIENLASVPDIDHVVQPIFDMLWQCFGLERCSEYDADGRWKPRS